MARTMKDKKKSQKDQSEKVKKITSVKKAIKKSSPKNINKKPQQNAKTTKKQVIASPKKQKKSTTSSKSKRDVITSLTTSVLKKVKKQVQSYQQNVKASAKKTKKEKSINDEHYDSNQDSIVQQESRDIELNSSLSNDNSKRKRARQQNSNQSLVQSKSPNKSTLNTKTAPQKVKVYKRQTRSGKQYGEVKIKGNVDLLEEETLKSPIKSSTRNTKKNILKQKDKKFNENEFLESEDATLSIRYRRPNKNLQINDESENSFMNNEKNTSKIYDKQNNIFSTSFQQNITVNTTADTSRGCSISREDIQNDLDQSRNSNMFLIRGNNLPKKTVCAKQIPLIFKKPMTLRESIPQVKTKRSVLAMDIEQNKINGINNQQDQNLKADQKRSNSNNKYPQNDSSLDRSFNRKNDIEQQQNDETGKQLVDFVFCCDTTSSMGEYLQATIDYIAAIYKKTQPFEQIIDIKYGFVCYRDHPPEESSYLYRISNLNTPLKTIQFIQQQDAEGGGDTPEAVMDGLYVATSGINWRKDSMKYIIHIADAPPHGDLYTGINGGFLQRSFVWRDGCPCGLTIEKIAKIMNSLQIHYRLIKAGDNMERMASVFKSCIEHYADIKVNSPEGLDFILSDMVAKQCLKNDDIQNENKYPRQSRSKQRSHSRNIEDIDQEQDIMQVENIPQKEKTFKGINRTYSNNYQAFKNNDQEFENEIVIEDSQQQPRQNYHQQQVYQNENENQRVKIQKISNKQTANQINKLPINYKQFAGLNLSRNYSYNLNDQDEIDV